MNDKEKEMLINIENVIKQLIKDIEREISAYEGKEFKLDKNHITCISSGAVCGAVASLSTLGIKIGKETGEEMKRLLKKNYY